MKVIIPILMVLITTAAAHPGPATYEFGGMLTLPVKTVGGSHAPRLGAVASALWNAGETQLGMKADVRTFDRGSASDSWDSLVGLRFLYRFPIANGGAFRVHGVFSPGFFVKTTKFSAESQRRNELIPPYNTDGGVGFGVGAALSYRVGDTVEVFSNQTWNAVAFEGPDYEFFSIETGFRLSP